MTLQCKGHVLVKETVSLVNGSVTVTNWVKDRTSEDQPSHPHSDLEPLYLHIYRSFKVQNLIGLLLVLTHYKVS